MKTLLKQWFFPLLLALIIGLIIGANYTQGTILSGWDTLHPEFNFPLAFSRIFTGVWRQDQGLGAVAIHSHIAELPRVFLLWLSSFILPVRLIRYTFFFGTLLIGPLGMYLATRHICSFSQKRNTIGFIAAITYLMNLGTVQHFIVPFEMFAMEYAFVPWILWTTLLFLEKPSKKHIASVACCMFIASSIAYAATLFYAFTLCYILMVGTYWVQHLRQWKSIGKRILVLLFILFCTNAYWLLPNIYAAKEHGLDVRNSKANSLFSSEAFAKGQRFGTIENAAIAKNFLFDWLIYRLDPQPQQFEQVLTSWTEHIKKPLVMGVGYGVFLLSIVGIFAAFRSKNKSALALLPFTTASFFMLLNGTWPMNVFFERLSDLSPVATEALRFPFTKFSIPFMAGLSIFAGYGMASIFAFMKRFRLMQFAITISYSALLVTYFFPAFTGNLIHPSMRVVYPKAYTDLFSWFDKQNHNERVAIFPIQTFWNWTYYTWGYQGAGFLQFGIPQPILDRDYDRWSKFNENYYWELSRAIYTKDPIAVESVFSKYDIRYILLDENVISRDNNRSLYIDETKALISQIPTVTVAQSFGNITVYERNYKTLQSFVSLKTNLPTVSPTYKWTDNDVAYQELGDYIADESCHVSRVACRVFPFRSLFTKRSVDEREFKISETDSQITIGDLKEATSASIIKRDALVFEATDSATLNPKAVIPCGVVGKGTAQASTIGSSTASDTGNQTIKPDHSTSLRFTSKNQRGCLSFDISQLPHKNSYLVAVESRHVSGRPLLLAFINDTARHVEMETYLDHRNSKKGLTFSGQNLWTTNYFILPPLVSDGLGYTVYISNDAIGNQETVNDIKSITFYRIPYQELVTLHSAGVQSLSAETQPQGRALSVEHPNPAFYEVSMRQCTTCTDTSDALTLILSQAFDPGWLAFTKTTTFPFLQPIRSHVLVNNWSNGWILNPTNQTIILFFWPQLLEWIGFALLPIPFMFTFLPKLFRPTHTVQSA